MQPFPLFVAHTLQLIKIKVTAAVTFSAAAGFFLFNFDDLLRWSLMLSGVFLQAGAASALNQLQERRTDALMLRTRSRPLPTGSLHPRYALAVVLTMLLTGSLILWSINWLPALLGLINVAIYNGLYTPLKRRSLPLAVVIGAFVGAIPPIMGWTSAGGAIWAPLIVMVAGFMYLWQIPHFGLLAIKYEQDYKHAGYRVRFRPVQIKRIIFISMLLLMGQTSGFFLLDIVRSGAIAALIASSSLALLLLLYFLLFGSRKPSRLYKGIPLINIYMMALLILLIMDQAIRL